MVTSRKGILGKVRNSFGVYDCYKLLRRNHWIGVGHPVSEKDFYAIVRGMNKLMADEIANGNTVKFPARMGSLELRKSKRGVSIVNDKLKITYPVNWDATLKLWEHDEEAKKQKLLIRYENEWIYKITYVKDRAEYENKVFYQFDVNSFIKKALAKNINQGKVDTLW